jgi:membrane-anchored protein YejM (alkaline phosphatase superfamily)
MLNGNELPRVSGLHGALKSMDDTPAGANEQQSFDAEQMKMLHQQQIRCVEYVDRLIGRLMEATPPNTHFIVTADHGELFGEDGYFGHGPIMHEKCFEVPFVEGRLPA